jgi:flagella basal body P-ring formation protein FlgA
MKLMTGIRRIGPLVAAALLCPMPGYAETQVQSLDAIRAVAQDYVRAKIPKQEPGVVEISVGSLDPRLRLARCADPLHAALPPGATFRARMTVAVSCAGGATWTVYVPVTVETKSSVLVLRHAAARGARLAEADIEVQVRAVAGTGESYLSQISELSGRTLKRPLAAGAALTADAFLADFIVRRGQQVTLLASAAGIEVRAPGRALIDGRAASRVRVQNLSSLQVVEGVVESADVIRVTP